MREAEFREWLGRRRYGGKELSTVNHRLASCRSVERALPALGFAEADLEAVHAAGRWDALLSAMSKLRSDWRNNEAAARVIAPQAENPAQQMANARNAVGQYGHFAKGDDPNYDESSAGEGAAGGTGRPFVLFDAAGQGFKPVKHGNQQTGVSAYRVKPKGASNRADEALEIETVAEVARLVIVEGLAARMQPLSGGPVNYLGYGKQKLVRYELDPAIADEIGVPAQGQTQAQGDAMTDDEILARFTKKSAFAEWWALWSGTDRAAFLRVLRATHEAGLDWYHVNIDRQVRCGRKAKGAIDATEVFAQIHNLEPRCWVRKEADRGALNLHDAASLTAFAAALDGAPEVMARFRGNRPGYWPDEVNPDTKDDKAATSGSGAGNAAEPDQRPVAPTNLILHGPPGTGKTYATASEAVRLCGAVVPDDREELMDLYWSLHKQGRIDFVTFHQNFSYEDFVEGLRPVTGQGDEASPAFELRPEAGIFRRVAEVAGKPIVRREAAFELAGRRIFKLSLGESGKRAWEWVYEQSIEDGYALFGFRNIDWTDPRFEERNAILAELQQRYPDEKITIQTGLVKSPDRFRNQLSVGDVVIISKGLNAFRAIGVVDGEYEYAPRPDGHYCHRRRVRWLWEEPQGVPVEEISTKRFSLDTVYELPKERLNLAALERYINRGEEGEADGELLPHVLIIDEINRANVSKVFGELITLIEPDKRLGMSNALTVRLPYSKREFGVPANLHIVGTMNTADRSIALLDTALRRRFTFREVSPEPGLLGEEVDGVPLRRVLEAMNDRIEYLVDRDHRVGHAFFMGEGGRDRAAIDRTMRDKVIPLLQEYFFEDWSRVAAVLGERPERGGGFLVCRKLKDPTGKGGEQRLSWTVRPAFAEDAYRNLVARGTAAAGEGDFGTELELDAEAD